MKSRNYVNVTNLKLILKKNWGIFQDNGSGSSKQIKATKKNRDPKLRKQVLPSLLQQFLELPSLWRSGEWGNDLPIINHLKWGNVPNGLNWVALSREYGNETIHSYDGDSFPHSSLRASQISIIASSKIAKAHSPLRSVLPCFGPTMLEHQSVKHSETRQHCPHA